MPEPTKSPKADVVNPKMITFARKRRGLKKTELAKLVGLDLRTITAYESGEKNPPLGTLVKLHASLDFPLEFFYGEDIETPPPDGVSFRAMSRMSARLRDMAEAQGGLAMRFTSWLDARFVLPPSLIPDLRHLATTPEVAADSLRRIWNLGELPVRNMVHLLEANGVRVFSLSIEAKEVDAFSWWIEEVPFVMLNSFKSAEHSRFDAAHELAHLVLHRHIGAARSRDAEFQADAFASAFLMPKGSVLGHAPRFPTLAQLINLKQIWGVSVSALNYRMHKLGLSSDWQYRSLCISLGQKGFRTQEPCEQPRESSAILPKLLKSLYEEDKMARPAIARELAISSGELNRLLFGLAITPIEGARNGASDPNPRINLVVVK